MQLRQKRHSRVEPLQELDKIRIVDNGEPLIDLRLRCTNLLLIEDPDWFGGPRLFYVRPKVADKLVEASRHLPPDHRLLIWFTYRTPETQKAAYEKCIADLRARHPAWPYNILRREANRLVHPPDSKTPPGHCTGGAVDLTIVGPDGEELDMTSPYTDWDEAKLAVADTMAKNITDTAAKNRELLVTSMSAVGFTNYAGEWWHWSYGDSGWAWRMELNTAIYGQADPQTVLVSE